MKKYLRGRSPPENKEKKEWGNMKMAERAGRLLCTAAAVIGGVFLLLPIWGIRADAVLSGSMEPALKTGSIVFTDTEKTDPEVGDIITYRLGSSYVTHRVVEKEGSRFVTRGDSNNGRDAALVDRSQIVGTAVFSVPILGYAAVFLQKKTVFCLLLLMIVQELVFLVVSKKGERGKKSAGKIHE